MVKQRPESELCVREVLYEILRRRHPWNPWWGVIFHQNSDTLPVVSTRRKTSQCPNNV